MNTGLFREQAVYGNLRIETAVMNHRSGKKDNPEADRACGILLLAMRDLALGMYNLGSGYSIGRGFLCAESLTVQRADGATATIMFKNDNTSDQGKPAEHSDKKTDARNSVSMSLEDPHNILDQCFRALWEMKSEDNTSRTSDILSGKEEA